AAMTENLKQSYAEDIKIRTEGLEGLSRKNLVVNVHEMSAGSVYRDANVTVRAIPVPHGSWPQAFGYAIAAAGRSIVISGDTSPAESIVEACQRCDVLVHEVYSADRFDAVFGRSGGEYHTAFHTSTRELGELASKSKPKLLVLYHQLIFGPHEGVDLEKELRR